MSLFNLFLLVLILLFMPNLPSLPVFCWLRLPQFRLAPRPLTCVVPWTHAVCKVLRLKDTPVAQRDDLMARVRDRESLSLVQDVADVAPRVADLGKLE